MPSGVYAAAITPARAEPNLIDTAAALEVIEFLNSSQVEGIALLGTYGNFVHFDREERERFVAFGIKRSRKPVLVNVTHSTLELTAQLAEHASDAGAAAVLVMPPYFFPYAADRVEAYFRVLRKRLSLQVPLLLANSPFFTSPIPAEVAARLMGEGLYAGIVDESGQGDYLTSIANGILVVGNDAAIRAARCQSAGVVSGCACAVPELVSALDRALLERDAAGEALLGGHLGELMAWLDRFPVPFGIMEACRLRKMPARPDGSWLGHAPIEAFRDWFLNWLPVVLRDAKSL